MIRLRNELESEATKQACGHCGPRLETRKNSGLRARSCSITMNSRKPGPLLEWNRRMHVHRFWSTVRHQQDSLPESQQQVQGGGVIIVVYVCAAY